LASSAVAPSRLRAIEAILEGIPFETQLRQRFETGRLLDGHSLQHAIGMFCSGGFWMVIFGLPDERALWPAAI
jgi:hypothetical protein